MNPAEPPRADERVKQLEQEVAALRTRLEKALQENERLRRKIEELLRHAKRQAAPFARGTRKADPQRPGRKPGRRYGTRSSRPRPETIHQVIPVPLPPRCGACGGQVRREETHAQFQEDIVRATVVRRFDVAIGRCTGCGRRVQGRHPLQTSDALGAAQVQLGPEAIALAAHLNKEMGLSHARVARVLDLGYGLRASRSGVCRALARLADLAAPTYDQLVLAVRHSLVIGLDETGWRVDAILRWLWVAVSPQVTVFAIAPGRGFAAAASIVGRAYEGFLIHDGWRPYYRFPHAFHQSCVSHLLRRCRHLIELAASPAAAAFPHAVKARLTQGLALRDRFHASEVSAHGLAVATGRLEAAMDRLLARPGRSAPNRRLAKHLGHEQPYVLSFLHCPGLDATNNAAERALRPAVIARKTWGGNRTWPGARVQQILTSILCTCQQQGKAAFPRLVGLLRAPTPPVLDIMPAAHSP